ncbi:MAG: thiamine-phosphate kinase [Merismopedia sp. SIO2A8]|nr:thiamine-phosphate kinase [Symploca sp. SIO2B6]NET51434.1 thiamine-phosphate kinase [Merismopedia sp. SIO2A8]
MHICDLGEQGLLQRLQSFCPSDVIGDDAALMTVTPGHQLVVTTDVLVDGVHFSWGNANPEVWTTSPHDAGWRAAAANLSDLAAMGAHPLGITVGLSLPPRLLVADLEAFYTGLVDCLTPFDVPIVGGDVCRSSVMTVAIAAFGQVIPQHAIYRSAAQPGDAIIATGYHGGSRTGLELLLHPEQGIGLSKDDYHYLIQTHQRPHPRLDVVDQLDTIRHHCVRPQNALNTFRVAGMDSSDGLADAVLQICRASRVGARIDRQAIPIPPALSQWRSPEIAMRWALYGGEDFELVLCCQDAIAHDLIRQIGSPAAIIGTITSEVEVILTDSTGEWNNEMIQFSHSFQHF